MFRFLCRISEWLKLQKIIWGIMLAFASIGFTLSSAAYTLRLLDGVESEWAQLTTNSLNDVLNIDQDIEGFLRTISLAIISFSIPYLFVVCQQRKAVLDALASGYWNNYLRQFVAAEVQLFILQPSPLIFLDTEAAIAQSKRQLEKAHQIELREEFVPSAKRSAFLVYQDGKSTGIAIDMCRNLTVLGDIIQRELSRPVGGTFCTVETKFEYLSAQYFRVLKKDWIEMRDVVGHVHILDGETDPMLVSAISAR